MGTVPSGAPQPLFAALKKTGRFRIFVETGTGSGDTALAAGDFFDTVITLEADAVLAEAAHERLSGRKGILPLAGDSRELLPQLLPRLAGPAVFWLPAGAGQAPALLAEIAAVAAAPVAHAICIGNARQLVAPSSGDAANGPALDAVLKALGAGTERDVVLTADTLLALPRASAILWDTLFPEGRPEPLVV